MNARRTLQMVRLGLAIIIITAVTILKNANQSKENNIQAATTTQQAGI